MCDFCQNLDSCYVGTDGKTVGQTTQVGTQFKQREHFDPLTEPLGSAS